MTHRASRRQLNVTAIPSYKLFTLKAWRAAANSMQLREFSLSVQEIVGLRLPPGATGPTTANRGVLEGSDAAIENKRTCQSLSQRASEIAYVW